MKTTRTTIGQSLTDIAVRERKINKDCFLTPMQLSRYVIHSNKKLSDNTIPESRPITFI